MKVLLLVGVGGFFGAIGRYAIGGGIQRAGPVAVFPLGTLAVNVAGCLAIGFLAGAADLRGVFQPETRALLFIGFLGAFTTFSTFAYETLALARDGDSLKAAANVLLHVTACLLAVWLGDVLVRAYWSAP